MSDWDRYGSEQGVRGTVYDTDYQERVSEGEGRARKTMEQVRHSAQDAGGRVRKGFDRYFHGHPLLVGAGVFALGVAVGLTVPGTRQEDRWLGESSDRFKERTREAAARVGHVAKESLKEAAETARSEMEERGLDAQSLREGAEHIAQDARDVAEKAAKEARRSAEEEAERNNLR